MRTLATPEPIMDWSPTSLKDKLIKIGAGREPRPLCRIPDGRGRHPTANVPGDFAIDRGTTAAATASARVRRQSSRIQGTRQEEYVQLPAKIARSTPRPSFVLFKVTVTVQTSLYLVGRREKREYPRQTGGNMGKGNARGAKGAGHRR